MSEDVYCACSGNYTTDKLMFAMGFNVHSNDVSLYSKLISDIVLGRDTTPMEIKDERLAEVFSRWEPNPLKKLCMVMYVMKFSNFFPQRNQYQIEMMEVVTTPSQAEHYYKETLEKLNKGALDFKISDFCFGDFVGFLKSKKGKGIGIAFPPTYKGGYEKMFKAVEDTFEYEHAEYDLFDPKGAGSLYEELLSTDENIIYTDREYEEIKEYMSAKVSLGPGKHPVYVYSSVENAKHYFVEKNMTPQKSKYKTCPLDFEFTEDTVVTVEIAPIMDINYFKAFYMANKVNYTYGGDLGLVFLADGLAFGFASFSHRQSTYDTILGLADFVVNSHTEKLSKLLIMLELSHDVQMMIAKSLGDYFTYIKTPVYTQSAVSMKYRGVFKLEKREPGKLTYIGEFGKETIQNIYRIWLKKYKK